MTVESFFDQLLTLNAGRYEVGPRAWWVKFGGQIVTPGRRLKPLRFPITLTGFDDLTNAPGVYGIVLHNGQLYIGSSVRIKTRVAAHVRHLMRGVHHSSSLQDAYNNGGISHVYVIEACDASVVRERERQYIQSADNVINVRKG